MKKTPSYSTQELREFARVLRGRRTVDQYIQTPVPDELVRVTLDERHEGVQVISAKPDRLEFRIEGGFPSGTYKVSINNRRTNVELEVFSPVWKQLQPTEVHQPWAGFGEILASARDAAWGLFLIVVILGGIYGGIFTPTEAAAVAANFEMMNRLLDAVGVGPSRQMLPIGDEIGVPLPARFA